MTAPTVVLGRAEPRLSTEPLRELSPETSLGFEAIAFARDVLGVDLLPWQEWWLVHALELRPEGGFRYRTVLTLVARQNGKTTLLKIVSLWFMFLAHGHLVLGAAQALNIARESWQGAVALAEGHPELADEIVAVRRTNGEQCLTITGGARYMITAATRSAGRGLSVDLLILDELREQRDWDAWGALSKDLPDSTPILRADGTWTVMRDLAIGDRVFGPSGKPAAVTEVQPVDQLRPMYRVTTTDGRSLIASGSHLWTVKDVRRSYDLTAGWETLTTEQIIGRGLHRKAQEYAFRLPRQHALVDLPHRVLPLDPYVVGSWLGDGTSADGTLTVGGQDLDATSRLLTAAGASEASRIETRPGTWRVRLHVGGRPLRTALREVGILGDKHAPDAYLTASSAQRLALLQGLMDTGGCVTPRGDAKFTGANERLADAVLFLARSLGWSARKTDFIPRIDGRACGVAWTVTFCVRVGDPVPFRLPRKVARCHNPRPGTWLHASIASIEPVPTEPSRCIAVDSDDHLFLAGRDLVPTHNTTIARPNALIVGISNQGDDESVVLNSLRSAALAGSDPSVGLFEWSAPDGCPIDDVDAWAQANPGLGRTITEAAVRSASMTDPPATFRTEVLCQRVDSLDSAIDLDAWRALAEPGFNLAAVRRQVVGCLDVALDGGHVALVLAAPLPDGRVGVEVAGAWSSVEACRVDLRRLAGQLKLRGLGWYPSGPGAVLGPELGALNGDVVGVRTFDHQSMQDYAPGVVELQGRMPVAACMSLAEHVASRKLVHSGDPLLTAHVTATARLDQGDGWRFARKGSGQINAAYAAAGALHLARTLPPVKALPQMAVF